jgi:hypothetical protein
MNKNTSSLDRLDKHFKRVADKIENEIIEASEKFSGTPESVALAREAALRKYISRFFPSSYRITKGNIYDSFGNVSASIDCVICAPNHPLFPGDANNTEIILADGVHAVIELKTDLSNLPEDYGEAKKQKPEVITGLGQIDSVKLLKRAAPRFLGFQHVTSELQDYSTRCPAYIFAYNSCEIEKLCKYIADYYIYKNIPLSEQVDMIYVLKKGVLMNNKCEDHTLTKPESGKWHPHIAAYGPEQSFTLFLLRLVSEIGPEMTMSVPVLKRYIEKMNIGKSICAYKTIEEA